MAQAPTRPALPAEAGGRTVPVLLALLFLLAPALGVPGELMLQDTLKSAIVALGALLAALLFLLDQRRRSEPLRWHGVLWLPLLLAAYALGSMLWSHPYLGGVEAVRWFVFALLAWLALNTLARERLPLLAWCLHAGAVLASVWAAAQFWGGLSLFPQGPQPASTFVNRNFFAEYVVCTLPWGALLLARERRPAVALALAASLGFVLTAILMTGTRGALIAAGLLLLGALPLAAWRCRAALAFRQWPAALRVAVPATLLGMVLILGNAASGNPKILEEGYGDTPIARGLHRAESIGPGDHSLGIRMEMWRATLKAIAAHPLAGLGAGAWENEIPLYQSGGAQLETDYYVHNEFLQLVAEYGLVGWAFLLLLAAWLVHTARRTWHAAQAEADHERPWCAAMLCSLLALMVVSSIGFPWRMAATGALFAICVGGLAASAARLRQEGRLLARPLPWSPAIGRTALAAGAACLALGVYVTQQAAECERKLAGAARIALGITASGEPNDPRFAPLRRQMLQMVREGIAINPHYRKITPLVGDELARWGDWEDAVWIWGSVLASRPNVVVLLTNMARGQDTLGHPEEAEAFLRRAQRIQPDAPAVRSLEVVMLARGGQERLAMRKAQAALDAGIADYDLVNAYFILALRAKDYPQAQRLLERRMRDWPETRPRGLVQLGLLQDQGFHDAARALESFRQGLASASPQERPLLWEQVPPAYRAELGAPPQTSASSR